MYRESVQVLEKLLEEVKAHPVLRAQDHVKSAPQLSGFDQVVEAMDRRIRAVQRLEELAELDRSVQTMALLPSLQEDKASAKIIAVLEKVHNGIGTACSEIEEADGLLDLVDEDAQVEAFALLVVEHNLEDLVAMPESSEAFSQGTAALADLAMQAGLFYGCDPDDVEDAMSEAMVEFLPALARAGAAIARGAGKLAVGAGKAAGKAAWKGTKLAAKGVAGAAKAAYRFGRGAYKGFKATTNKGAAKSAALKGYKVARKHAPNASKLARKVGSAVASKVANTAIKRTADYAKKKIQAYKDKRAANTPAASRDRYAAARGIRLRPA